MKTISYTRAAVRALRKHRNVAAADHVPKSRITPPTPPRLANMATKMVGKDSVRLRVGDFRVLFRETATEVIILDIGPRGRIYE